MQQAIRTENNQAKKTDKTSPEVKKHSGAAAAVKQAVRAERVSDVLVHRKSYLQTRGEI